MASPAAKALADAALVVARRRAHVLERLRAALLDGDDRAALRLARVATGLEEDDAGREVSVEGRSH